MKLGICRACGAAQYPAREVCAKCLSDAIEVREREVLGEIVSLAKIHRSADAKFAGQTPAIASVKMDAGPVAISFVSPEAKLGARVRLSASGESPGLLVASPLPAAAKQS
jgi:uncharacterized OB-fold protein